MLGKYEIRSTLGRGAMGVVYEGWDPIISRRVAIKTVRLPDAADEEAQEELARFRREAQAAGRLNHPNVVGVFDYNETADLAYIVMEFVEGQTLKGLIGEKERMALPTVMRILKDVLAGLAYCHERGVVHRDIKPANIMITPEGQAKIADFGIARIESSSMTQAGTVLGTPAYMSPEQFMGVVVDARTDIYSTGVLLFQLLTGERPFEGSMTTIMHKVLNTVPPKPSDLAVTAPRPLDDVVGRAMARRPEDRFASAAAFSEAMQAALAAPVEDGTVIVTHARPAPPTPTPTPAPPPPPAPPPAPPAAARRSRAPLLAGVALLVLAAGGAGAYFLTRPPAAPTTIPGTGGGGALPRREAQTQPPDQPHVQPPGPGPAQVPRVNPSGQTPSAGNADLAAQQPANGPSAAKDAGPRTVPTVAPPPGLPPMEPAHSPGEPRIASNQPPPLTGAGGGPVIVGPSHAPLAADVPAPGPSTAKPPPTDAPLDPGRIGLVTEPAGPGAKPDVVAPTIIPPTDTPPMVAMLTPAQLRPALSTALASTPCAYTFGTLSGQGVADIQGVAAPAALVALQHSAEAAAPGVNIGWDVTDIDPAFCPAIDLVRALQPEFGSPRATAVNLTDGKIRLVTDEYIVPHVTMPGFAGYLLVDYLVHDGTVVHLYPNKGDPAANDPNRRLAAHAQVRMGEPKGAFPGWQVYEPYGRDLIMAVASSTPLMGIRPVDPQTQSEPSGPYLAALQSAIENARRHDAHLAADAMVLETAAKQ
jgi:serine/threonine-protein kinase